VVPFAFPRPGAFDVSVIDNLYRLKDLNGPAFRDYLGQGGVLVILNPKVDGHSKAWSPYDIFIGKYAVAARIVDRKHPLFHGWTNDRIENVASPNGAFVGTCAIVEPAIVGCTRFDHYNAKPAATCLGGNLCRYSVSLAKSRDGGTLAGRAFRVARAEETHAPLRRDVRSACRP